MIDIIPNIETFFTPVEKSHITLLVFKAEENRSVEVHELFKKISKEFSDYLKSKETESVEVEFSGLGSFDKRVLFLHPMTNLELLAKLNSLLFEAFSDAGFLCDPNFNPHLTIAKAGKRKSELGIPTSFIEAYKEKSFGIEAVSKLQLLSMEKPAGSDGYYALELESKLFG